MKHLSWLALPAVFLTFIFIMVPAILWLVDLIFRKPLEQKIFAVHWNKYGISAAIIFWILEYFF